MDYILKKQRERNSSTAQHQDLYAGHRHHVMSIIQEVGRGGRICVLGAGNCNDLDLARLQQWFTEVHLVDWDAASLHEGVAKQQVASESVVLHAGIEVTGVAGYMERWKRAAPSNDEINQVVALLSAPYDIGLGVAFDVVLSGSLLTQLIEMPVALLGPGHPRMVDVVMQIRAAHFRLMMSLMAPGGTGVLVTELMSSDTCEELRHSSDEKLPALYARLVREKRYFTGTNPDALTPALLADPFIAPQITQSQLIDPWRWQIGPNRFFLAYGFVFKKMITSG